METFDVEFCKKKTESSKLCFQGWRGEGISLIIDGNDMLLCCPDS